MNEWVEIFQRAVFEMTSDFDPTISSILAGYAVQFFFVLYITPAGEAYLARAGT